MALQLPPKQASQAPTVQFHFFLFSQNQVLLQFHSHHWCYNIEQVSEVFLGLSGRPPLLTKNTTQAMSEIIK